MTQEAISQRKKTSTIHYRKFNAYNLLVQMRYLSDIRTHLRTEVGEFFAALLLLMFIRTEVATHPSPRYENNLAMSTDIQHFCIVFISTFYDILFFIRLLSASLVNFFNV
jgi:hypothetical protein